MAPLDFLPEQIRTLESWSAMRDALLRDIAVLTEKKETLTKSVRDLSLSADAINNRIIDVNTRLEMVVKIEEDRKKLLSKDIDKLTTQYTELASKIGPLQDLLRTLEARKNDLESMITTLINYHDRVEFRVSALDKVVDRVVRISEGNITTVNGMVAKIKEAIGIK